MYVDCIIQICNGDRDWSGTAPRCVPKIVSSIISDQNMDVSDDKILTSDTGVYLLLLYCIIIQYVCVYSAGAQNCIIQYNVHIFSSWP